LDWVVNDMPKYRQDDEQITDGVNLLIPILVRYPEITSISFDPETHTLKQTFMLSGIPDEAEFFAVRKILMDSISVYYILEGITDTNVDIQLSKHENVAMLHIIRDVQTLSKGEIALIIAILQDRFRDSLIVDTGEAMLEDEIVLQEELIDNMLNNITKHYSGHRVIGIREDGRVMVFNK